MAYLYKITNNINNKFYYGVHSLNKNHYFGSGILIKKAIKTYGKNNFNKRILFEGSLEDCYELEELVVNDIMVADEKCYNMCLGGTGGLLLVGDRLVKFKNDLAKRNIERVWTDEAKAKISAANKNKVSPFKGLKRVNKGNGTGRKKGCIPWNKGIKQKDYDKKET
jgi:hypothetical protein